MTHSLAQPDALLADLRRLIDEVRAQAAQAANSALTMLHWEIGQRIRDDVLGHDRAGYGEKIVATLSQPLVPVYGRGFTRTALARMQQIADDARSYRSGEMMFEPACSYEG